MSIAFKCTQCGKHYEVSDNLAGKKGKCKACGNMMAIPKPQPAADLGGGNDPFGLEETAQSAPVRSAKPAAGADPYGIDEEPGAAPLSRLPYQASAESAPAAKPKKKKKSGSAKKESNTGRNVLGASFGSIVAIILIGLRFYNAVGFGMISRADLERYSEADVALVEELTSILKTVQDEPSANAAGPRMVAAINRMITYTKELKSKKARKTDIEAVKQKFEPRRQAAAQAWLAECQRAAFVPGAAAALQAILAPANELQRLQSDGEAAPAPIQPQLPAMPGTPPQMPPGVPNIPPGVMPNVPADLGGLPTDAPSASPGGSENDNPAPRPARPKFRPRRLQKQPQ